MDGTERSQHGQREGFDLRNQRAVDAFYDSFHYHRQWVNDSGDLNTRRMIKDLEELEAFSAA